MASKPQSKHTWTFFRAGGVDQVRLSSGADLEHLAELDQKLWVALACPTRGLHLDARSLELVDTDHDGRIRPPEILAAIAWAGEVLRSLDDLFEGDDELPLASIDADTPAGRPLLAGAKRILSNLGKDGAKSISLAEVADTEKIFRETKLNGDGIVPADSADDDATRKAIEDVIAVVGSAPDRSGKPGVDADRVRAFFDRVDARAAWLDRADADPAVRVLGDATTAAGEALGAVSAKIDDYFVRCRLAAFDGRVGAQLGLPDAAIAEVVSRELATDDAGVSRMPLARPEPGRALPLASGIDPAWSARMAAFLNAAVVPLLGAGRTSLAEAEWTGLKARLGPWRDWQAAKPVDAEVEKLGAERVRELSRSGARQAILQLVAHDAALAEESNQIEAVEKMIRLRRDFVPLLRNFVNFSDFYGTRLGAFQVGTLYVDGRSCDLCLPVHDVAKHAALAGLAQAYLAYCDCARRKDAEKQTIVAAITAGDVDNLMVGRNGVFYDRKGDDWDATITKIVENPISVRQAFWMPYKRVVRFIEAQVAKRASAADVETAKKLEVVETSTEANKETEKKKEAEDGTKHAGESKIDVGTVAALGVAIGGLATFFSSILATFLGLGMWMPLGLAILLLAVSGPSMLIAWLKLRQRNVGPILDANGWAVNAFARINVPFGGALTSLSTLPAGASRSLKDPFAEKESPWRFYGVLLVAAVVAFAWFLGKFDAYLPVKARAMTVFHRPPVGAEAAPEKK